MSVPRKKHKSGQTTDSESVCAKCIIHNDDCKSDTIILLSELSDPEGRFQKILDVCKRRLDQPTHSAQRKTNICEQVPAKYSPELKYGYHRDCYQYFTGNLDRLKRKLDADTPGPIARASGRRSSGETDRYIFKPDCIFCRKGGPKKIKVGQSWTTEPLIKFEYGGGETVQRVAEQKHDIDILTRIKGYDLFACEAQFHKSCRKTYVNISVHRRSDSVEAKTNQTSMEMAHQAAYNNVCELVNQTLIAKQGVVKLTDLVQQYVTRLQDSPYPNPNYRPVKLATKLKKSYPQSLSFVQLSKEGTFQSQLVYSSTISAESAVLLAYDLSTTDRTRDVALDLRNQISNAFETSAALCWPPTASVLEVSDNVLPEELEKILIVLVTGHSDGNVSNRVERLVQSIGQDLCRAVTNGKWKLPKHILFCMTLRHMFRSAELTTLLNRFGHSENYSFAVELETALATALQQTSNLLTGQIVCNPPGQSTFHSDFDNFDQLTATGSVHTANGIMLQELTDGRPDAERPSLPILERTGARSLKLTSESDNLPDCYITQRSSPSYRINKWTCPTGESAMEDAEERNMMWTFTRYISSGTNQEVPGWSGYISVTGKKPASVTTIDYYPVINSPITDYKTVQ